MAGPVRSICAAPSYATGLRPPASGGASQMNPWRGSAPRPAIHETRQQVVTPRASAAHQECGSHCSACKGQSGRLRAGCFAKGLLASLAPAQLARCLEGGEKVRAFLPLKPPRRPASTDTKSISTHPPRIDAIEFTTGEHRSSRGALTLTDAIQNATSSTCSIRKRHIP
jgi:hypothetical protein